MSRLGRTGPVAGRLSKHMAQNEAKTFLNLSVARLLPHDRAGGQRGGLHRSPQRGVDLGDDVLGEIDVVANESEVDRLLGGETMVSEPKTVCIVARRAPDPSAVGSMRDRPAARTAS
jgi:hypothetical protein